MDLLNQTTSMSEKKRECSTLSSSLSLKKEKKASSSNPPQNFPPEEFIPHFKNENIIPCFKKSFLIFFYFVSKSPEELDICYNNPPKNDTHKIFRALFLNSFDHLQSHFQK